MHLFFRISIRSFSNYALAFVYCIALTTVSYAETLKFTNYPLEFSNTSQAPNVLILYDNSGSMDSQMDPSYYLGGNDPNSRSNIARNTLRTILNNYHTLFNWGLEIFDTFGSQKDCLANNGLCGNFSNFQGNINTMKFTNDCINGISNSNGGLHCIPNPEPNGYNFITYAVGTADGSSASVSGPYNPQWFWGTYKVGDNSGYNLDLFLHHNTNVTTWLTTSDNSTAIPANADGVLSK